MERIMRRKLIQFTAGLLAAVLCIPAARAANVNSAGQTMIRVGLASASPHNSLGELASAHLENNTGYGAGFRFGYYDDNLNFVELGRTGESVTKVAVLKTQNLWYGYVSSLDKDTYSDKITSGTAVGCYHLRLPGDYPSWEEAKAAADQWGGFPAWIDGSYQVRAGSYLTQGDAEAALAELGQGSVVWTSAYGMSVVKTGTAQIIFQFDMGEGGALGILPDVTGALDVRTWFSGYKYRGGFQYRRLTGGDLTVINVVELEDYVRGVACYEMGRLWPLDALKTQSVCARTYALRRLGYHGERGFDVCNTDYCQVYRGVGSKVLDYGPSDISDLAVSETAGQVLYYGDDLVETYYSSSHGGASEDAKNIWGSDTVEKYPYLRGVIDPYEHLADDINGKSPWTVTYTAGELQKRLQSYGYGTRTSLDHLELTYSPLGNVLRVTVHWSNGQTNSFRSNGSGSAKTDIRGTFGLRSIHFTINGQTVSGGSSDPETGAEPQAGGYPVNGSEVLSALDGAYIISDSGTLEAAGERELYAITGSGTSEPLTQPKEETPEPPAGTNEGGGTVSVSGDTYIFNGGGWGHSVGMSQYGAYAMANQGFAYDQILTFYFPGTHVGAYSPGQVQAAPVDMFEPEPSV